MAVTGADGGGRRVARGRSLRWGSEEPDQGVRGS